MTDTPAADTSSVNPFTDDNLTVKDHLDPDKHFIGDALAAPSAQEIAAGIGNVSGTGFSPIVARADHTHKVDPTLVDVGFFPLHWYVTDAAAIDATTATTFVTWLTSNQTFTVPTWATSAFIQVNLTNIWMTVAASTTYALDATIAPGGSFATDRVIFTPAAISERMSTSFTALATGFGTGAGRDVRVGARRASGTGVLRHDSSCRTTGFIIFKA